MSESLPDGWVLATLSQIALINPQRPKGLDDTLPVSFAPMAALSEDKPTFQFLEERPWGDVRKGFTPFADGDVLFAKITPCMENGKGAVATKLRNGLGCGTTELHVVRPLDNINPNYIYRFLAQPVVRQQARDSFTGTAGQERVPSSFIEELEIPVAPVEEQERIVAKLEPVLDKVHDCEGRLDQILAILKRFRQSVLASACSGRLTAGWRDQHPVLESADDLLERIRNFRLASAKSKKEIAQIEEVFDEGNLRIDEGELGLDDIPDTWLSCRVGAIGAVHNGSTPSRKESRFWGGTIPWVSSGEVRNNVISESRQGITEAGYGSSSVRLLPRGTVLVAMIGEGKTRGQSAILDIEATINQNIAAVVLDHGLVRPDYLWWWFQLRYASTRERGDGSGPQALNCQRVRELPFVLPPLAEQHEIILRVKELFGLADRLESQIAEARTNVEALARSIIAKAFCGELVATEAEMAETEGRGFESGEELLARIREDKDSESRSKKMTTPGRRKTAASV